MAVVSAIGPRELQLNLNGAGLPPDMLPKRPIALVEPDPVVIRIQPGKHIRQSVTNEIRYCQAVALGIVKALIRPREPPQPIVPPDDGLFHLASQGIMIAVAIQVGQED